MKDSTDRLAVIKAVAEVTPILLGQKAVAIKDAVTAFRAGDFKPLVEAFKAKYKNFYDATGQNTRSLQVKHIDGGYPRAYAVTPTMYFSPASSQEVFMYVPVDYKGQSFEPQDARLLYKKQSDTIGMGLWAGGHSDPVPVVHRVDPYGVETPEDFDPSVSMCERHPAPFDHTKTEVLLTVFNNIQKYVVVVGALPGVETPDDIELKCEIITRTNNRPGLLAAAFNKHTGERLTFKENAYFRPVPVGTMFEIQPQEKFAGGCKHNFGVTFPLTEKIEIVKNPHPLYKWLTQKELNQQSDFVVHWNFYKFLINEDGSLFISLPSTYEPYCDDVLNWLEN